MQYAECSYIWLWLCTLVKVQLRTCNAGNLPKNISRYFLCVVLGLTSTFPQSSSLWAVFSSPLCSLLMHACTHSCMFPHYCKIYNHIIIIIIIIAQSTTTTNSRWKWNFPFLTGKNASYYFFCYYFLKVNKMNEKSREKRHTWLFYCCLFVYLRVAFGFLLLFFEESMPWPLREVVPFTLPLLQYRYIFTFLHMTVCMAHGLLTLWQCTFCVIWCFTDDGNDLKEKWKRKSVLCIQA